MAQFKFLISSYNQMKRAYEPLGGPGKQCQLVPIKVACTLALSRGCREVLESLGGTVPEAWLKADRIAANAERGEVDGRDLLPEEDLDAEIPEDELFARAVLASEMLAVDLENAEEAAAMAEDEEKSIGRNYALTDEQTSAALRGQLDEMSKWRTEVDVLFFSEHTSINDLLFI